MTQHARPTKPAELPIDVLLRPFQQFARQQTSGGIVLLACAVAALLWANSPWSESYERLWETHLRIGFVLFFLDEPLHFWINDAIMAVFFFVVGLEIKRELMAGELASPRRAALPVVAAVGGVLFPALIYLAFNAGQEGARGWGIPMATDIAFSLGALALLGSRVPFALKVFLAAFAIADDLGAVLVIAIFYTSELAWTNLIVAGGVSAALLVIGWIGVRHPFVYAILGTVVWLAMLKSGVHATLAGVLVAATVSSKATLSADQFLPRVRSLLEEFEKVSKSGNNTDASHQQGEVLDELEKARNQVESPLQKMERGLHPWVAFLVMPLFALANAGVELGGNLASELMSPVAMGTFFGLVAGKQIGITLFAWLAVRSGLAAMPYGVTWRHIYGVAWLGGIGFTVSLFITGLAFTDPTLVSEAKIGILAASIVAGVGGLLILRGSGQGNQR